MTAYRVSDYRVIDGDTVEATLELGFGISYTAAIRLIGVSAPEIDTAEGRTTKAKLTDYLQAESLVCDTDGSGSFGRILGRFVADGVDINQQLIEEHFATVYKARN